ncbi:ribosome modulation factor [Azohydromonas lata]
MHGNDTSAWNKGYEAGETFQIPCPYASGTPEEAHWLDGWLAGSARTLGLPHGRSTCGAPA